MLYLHIDNSTQRRQASHSPIWLVTNATIDNKPILWVCRHTAHEKGLDDLLRHVQANASPVIGRQIQCVLKHWQDLELGKAANPASEDDANDQQDDDVQDAHTGAADGLLEAESIHSWGMGPQPHCHIHVILLMRIKQRASMYVELTHAFSELHCEVKLHG